MATLDKDDFVKGTIEHSKEDIPKTKGFFLKPGITVNEGDDVLLTGNYTSDSATNDTTIFKGRIEDIDLHDVQKVVIVSKAEEIDTIKPSGDYHGYTECTLGDLINKDCVEVSCLKTQSTTTIRPNEDVFVYAGWWEDPPYGDGDDIFYDEIDEAVSDGDTTCILNSTGLVGYVYRAEFGFTNHALTGTYHYSIYRVDIVITMKKTSGNDAPYVVNFFDGYNWRGEQGQNVSSLVYAEYTETFDDLIGLSEDDINNFKMYYYKTSAGGVPVITKIEIVVYYQYYNNLSKATYKQDQTFTENKTLREIFNWAKLQELKTWYLDPDLEFYFNDGDVDSGVDIASTDKLSRIKGKKQIKNFDKVILKGGMSGGAQITSEAGAGNIIYTDTFANITVQATLDALATQILSDIGNYPLTVKMFRVDSVKGLIQPGEEVTIGAGIKYSGSSNTIVVGQYKIDRIKYFVVNGVYNKVDLTLSDGNVFKKKEQPSEQDQETTTLINQVAGAEGGEDNTGQNIGVDGHGVYSGKSGVTLQFRNVAPASSKVTVTLNEEDIDLDVAVGTTVNTVCVGNDARLSDARTPTAHVLSPGSGPHTGTLAWSELSKTGSSLAHLETRTHANLSDAPTDAHHVRYADSEAVSAVATADDYIKNDANDVMNGDLTVNNLITAGNVDGVDVSDLNTALREQSSTFPVAPSEGDRHYDEDDDSEYRYNDEAEAWIEVGVGGGKGSGYFDPAIGFIGMFSGEWVDNSTMLGWYKCDGNNGTPNLVDKFIRGAATSGGSGGSDDAVVVSHLHSFKSFSSPTGSGYEHAQTCFHDPTQRSMATDLTGVSGVGANIPAYYALIFIMRVS